jgi:hypothetical protein
MPDLKDNDKYKVEEVREDRVIDNKIYFLVK